MDTFTRGKKKKKKKKFKQKSHQLTHTWAVCGWWICRTCFCLVLPRELKQWVQTTWGSSSVKTNPSVRSQKNFIIPTKSTSRACAHVYTHAISLTTDSNVASDLPASIRDICETKTGPFSFGSLNSEHSQNIQKSNGNCFLTLISTSAVPYQELPWAWTSI